MERRSLGDTGIQLSVLGLGTVKLGRSEGVRYPKPFAIQATAKPGNCWIQRRRLVLTCWTLLLLTATAKSAWVACLRGSGSSGCSVPRRERNLTRGAHATIFGLGICVPVCIGACNA